MKVPDGIGSNGSSSRISRITDSGSISPGAPKASHRIW